MDGFWVDGLVHIGQADAPQPYATIGNPNWSDYDVTAGVLIEKKGGFAFILGRIEKISGLANSVPDGYRLALNNAASQWRLYATSDLLASGPVNVPTKTWHNLRQALRGVSLRRYVDGALVANYINSTFIKSMAGIGCDRHGAEFDYFALSEVHAGTGFNLALAAAASASSVWQDDPTHVATMANDGDPETRWNTAHPTEDTEWLEADWPTPVTFNQTTCSQYDDRILGYRIQQWDGSNWVIDVNGGQMGAYAADTFPAVISTKVRLALTNMVDSAPSIYEFGVYNASTNVMPAGADAALKRDLNQDK